MTSEKSGKIDLNVTRDRIAELERAGAKLRALEKAGVDMWEGYPLAMAEYNKEIEIENCLNKLFEQITEVLLLGVSEPSNTVVDFSFDEEAKCAAMSLMFRAVREIYAKMSPSKKYWTEYTS